MNSSNQQRLLSRRTPNREVLQLNQWLPLLIDEYRSSSLFAKQQLLLEIPDTLCRINFDSEQLRQVLINLISNGSSTASRPMVN